MTEFEMQVNRQIKMFYLQTGPVTFTWENLSPWTKAQWANKFWEEMLNDCL